MTPPTFADAVRPVYNRLLRPFLPRKWTVINGVAVRNSRLLDVRDHYPERMAGFLEAIEEVVDPGDTVVDIATGRAVAAVTAARAGATVRSYEGSQEMIEVAEETVEAARVDEIEIIHAVVGEPVDVWGETDGVPRVPPSELPAHDMLVLDCEGAEVYILECMEEYPRSAVIEPHPNHGAPTWRVYEVLDELGYDVELREHAPYQPEKDTLVARAGGRADG